MGKGERASGFSVNLQETWGRHLQGLLFTPKKRTRCFRSTCFLLSLDHVGRAVSDAGRHSNMSGLTSSSGSGFSPKSQDKGLQWKGKDKRLGTVCGQQGETMYPEPHTWGRDRPHHCKESKRRLVSHVEALDLVPRDTVQKGA